MLPTIKDIWYHFENKIYINLDKNGKKYKRVNLNEVFENAFSPITKMWKECEGNLDCEQNLCDYENDMINTFIKELEKKGYEVYDWDYTQWATKDIK